LRYAYRASTVSMLTRYRVQGVDDHMNPPVNPVMVLSNGARVPFHLRWCGTYFEPVIEGDVAKLMPMVIAIDADEWPSGAAIRWPSIGAASAEWAQRLLDNSPILKKGSTAQTLTTRAIK
jgi:hypothetical protein